MHRDFFGKPASSWRQKVTAREVSASSASHSSAGVCFGVCWQNSFACFAILKANACEIMSASASARGDTTLHAQEITWSKKEASAALEAVRAKLFNVGYGGGAQAGHASGAQ
eukprot:2474272-Amphidinium_carterae.1